MSAACIIKKHRTTRAQKLCQNCNESTVRTQMRTYGRSLVPVSSSSAVLHSFSSLLFVLKSSTNNQPSPRLPCAPPPSGRVPDRKVQSFPYDSTVPIAFTTGSTLGPHVLKIIQWFSSEESTAVIIMLPFTATLLSPIRFYSRSGSKASLTAKYSCYPAHIYSTVLLSIAPHPSPLFPRRVGLSPTGNGNFRVPSSTWSCMFVGCWGLSRRDRYPADRGLDHRE